MRRFDSVAIPQAEMRIQSLEARRFITIAGAMWESAWGELFENAPRPEVDKITPGLEKIETDYRENRVMVAFQPADDRADEDTADTLNGLYRADAYHFNAQEAKDNAFKEALRGGFGAYRLTTDYVDPYDPQNDQQRINPGLKIVDADQSVYFDIGATRYDKSDAMWAFVVTARPRAEAEAKWGADNIGEWPLRSWKWQWDWYTPDVVYEAEYYVVEETDDTIIILKNPLTDDERRFFESEIEPKEVRDMVAQGWKKSTRPGKRRRVRKYIMNGFKILRDVGYIAGCHIPIVPVYGRVDWVDNMERWRGYVAKRIDRQRIYNTLIAKLVEMAALTPREVPIFAPEQMTPAIAEEWARANVDRLPFLRALPLYNQDGSIATAGPLAKVEPPQVPQSWAALLQLVGNDLAEDDDNADEVKANTSVDAMELAADRVDSRSEIYLDNNRLSEQRAAEIYLSMARDTYFEPGREVETMTDDGQDGTAVLGEAVVDDNGVYRIRNDLSVGRYKVRADVQEATTTKRAKAVRQALELAEAFSNAQSPQDALAALYTAVQNMDGEAIHDLQDYARQKALQLGAVKPTPEEEREMQQAAAMQQQQPDPQMMLASAAVAESQSKVEVNRAKAVQTLADAHLKNAQADAVGGPVSAPETPSGLSDVDVIDKIAGANLKLAQADKLRDDITHQRIHTGHEIEMERRQQDLAEREPREKAA